MDSLLGIVILVLGTYSVFEGEHDAFDFKSRGASKAPLCSCRVRTTGLRGPKGPYTRLGSSASKSYIEAIFRWVVWRWVASIQLP